IGTRATMAARLATTTIPIVMVGVADPLAPHLAKSLSKPGGNVTGVSFMGAEVVEKELELLKEAARRLACRRALQPRESRDGDAGGLVLHRDGGSPIEGRDTAQAHRSPKSRTIDCRCGEDTSAG